MHNSTQLNKFISQPRQLWKCFNEIIHNKPNTKNQINSILATNGTVTHDPNFIANSLNHYFCNIGRELSLKIANTDHNFSDLVPFNSQTMALFPATCGEIQKIIQKIIHNIKPNSNLNHILTISNNVPIFLLHQLLPLLTNALQLELFPRF